MPGVRGVGATLLLAALLEAVPVRAQVFEVRAERVVDRKAVFATVESVDRAVARTRIAGTVVRLEVDEGDEVEAGQIIARVEDPKLALRLAALDAGIRALEAQLELARTELARTRELRKRNAVPQARLDQAEAQFRTVRANLAAKRAERRVVEEQLAEGEVPAPRSGRVLRVHVTRGSYVLPGEPVADIALQHYVLRVRLPERHARFLRPGDRVWIGPRGLGPGAPVGEGVVVKVYPELEGGRVVADIDAAGLGAYFVGERARIEIAAGTRTVYLVPPAYVGTRFGVDYVRLENGREVIVQRGITRDGRIEILAGLHEGDRLVPVEVRP